MPSLTTEQKDVIRSIIRDIKCGNKQIISCGGFAGVGKSTILRTLFDALPGYAPCAFTGKSANVLRRKGMEQASTIHSLIYKPEFQMDGSVEFRLAFPHEVEAEGFLVDEASMVSKEIYDDLLSFKRPIIFIGDHGQLEPVGTSFNVMEKPMYCLETVHRNAGPIAHFAEHIRKSGNVWQFEHTDSVFVCTEGEITDEDLLATGQIIGAFNKFRVAMNG